MNTDAEGQKELGNQCFKEGRFSDALVYYSRAIELNPKSSIYYANRGRAFKMLGRFEEALQDAQEAIELDEPNIRAHYLAGQLIRGPFMRNCPNS